MISPSRPGPLNGGANQRTLHLKGLLPGRRNVVLSCGIAVCSVRKKTMSNSFNSSALWVSWNKVPLLNSGKLLPSQEIAGLLGGGIESAICEGACMYA